MKLFPKADFTLKKYEELCGTILECEYKILTVYQFLVTQRGVRDRRLVILRHDVDRRPLNALRMAKIEHLVGIKSTYYFRANPPAFEPSIIEGVACLGHEIGYHYENMSDMGGDFDQAIKDFDHSLRKFRSIAPINTVCMHGSPLSRWDNRDLWLRYDYKDFGLIGEPYLSVDYHDVIYLTDTGRKWNTGHFSVRDRVKSRVQLGLGSTSALMEILKSRCYDRLLLQCHPERWSSDILHWVWSISSDCLTNCAKLPILYLWRRQLHYLDGDRGLSNRQARALNQLDSQP